MNSRRGTVSPSSFTIILTIPDTSEYLDSHANRPGMLTVGNESHSAGNERQIQLLLHHQVRVAVAAKYLCVKVL